VDRRGEYKQSAQKARRSPPTATEHLPQTTFVAIPQIYKQYIRLVVRLRVSFRRFREAGMNNTIVVFVVKRWRLRLKPLSISVKRRGVDWSTSTILGQVV
jgi:hypothetical protein